MEQKLLIGVTYQQTKNIYLATGSRTLVTRRRGRFKEVAARGKYKPMRSLSVDDLCHIWGVSLGELDRATEKYFAPLLPHTEPRRAESARASKGKSTHRLRLAG